MKLILYVLLGAVLAASTHEEEGHGERPKFCGNHWCPKFWTVAKRPGYEVRCYAPLTWAFTWGSEVNQKLFTREFRRLFDYIKGNNAAGKKYPMTVPVVTGNLYNSTTHDTISLLGFYVPTCCKHPAPAPKDSSVLVQSYRKFCVYVRSFGGRSMNNSKRAYMNLYWLSKAIEKDGRHYVKGSSTMAGYNSPSQLFFRHNEVWRILSQADQQEYLQLVEDPAFHAGCQEECPAAAEG